MRDCIYVPTFWLESEQEKVIDIIRKHLRFNEISDVEMKLKDVLENPQSGYELVTVKGEAIEVDEAVHTIEYVVEESGVSSEENTPGKEVGSGKEQKKRKVIQVREK